MNTQLQLHAGFIEREEEDTVILQRASDGYINATAMCKASEKRINDYLRLASTKAFLDELSSDTGNPVTDLIQIIQGGEPQMQGTWVHPQVAINLGQWASPRFAVVVSRWIHEWSTGKIKAKMPYHLERYINNSHKVPHGHFSMLNEMTLALIAPLEKQGYTLPDNMIPDISMGLMFNRYLRDNGYEPDDFPNYNHEYEDGRIVEARAYPNELLGMLREYFVEVWLKDRAIGYFSERDEKATVHLEKMLALPNYQEAMGYIPIDTQ